MPLSEDEQRILRQIEEQLQRDPGFGRTLHRPADHSRQSLAMWAIFTIACLALTVALLGISAYLSFAAFIGAVVGALFAERQARSIGEASLNHLSETVRGRFGAMPRPGARPGGDDTHN